MWMTLLLFFGSAAAIYVACELFVNGIEWLGRRLNLGATAVGTVLAALGTALPESAVTFFSVALGDSPAERDVGLGAALGGPLVLATVGYAVVGTALIANRRRLHRATRTLQVDYGRMASDQRAFLQIFVIKVVLGGINFAHKPYTALFFVAAYCSYVWRELRHDEDVALAESIEPLKIRPDDVDPALGWSLAQVSVALAIIAAASHIFVQQITAVGAGLKLPPHVIALLLSPVATELPEVMNACIWVRQGKERLALANISGSMMIQATLPSALGLWYTSWQFDRTLWLAGCVTTASIALLAWLFRRRAIRPRTLLVGYGFYGIFALYLLWAYPVLVP